MTTKLTLCRILYGVLWNKEKDSKHTQETKEAGRINGAGIEVV